MNVKVTVCLKKSKLTIYSVWKFLGKPNGFPKKFLTTYQPILPKNWVIVIEFSMKDGQFIFNLPTQMKMGRLNGRIFNRKRIIFFDSIKIFIIQFFQPFCDNKEI